jgi:hypothetical protein
MADKHANMPGMNEPAKKPEQGKPSEKSQQAPKPETPPKAADTGKSAHQHPSK